MCNGTESFGFQCNTPGPGVITNQECYNPNRTAGVRCITGESRKVTLHVLKKYPEKCFH